MSLMTRYLICTLVLFFTLTSFAQKEEALILPNHHDKYSEYVRQLEKGDTTGIDFLDFRISFRESKQYTIYRDKSTEFNDLKGDLYRFANRRKYRKLIKTAKAMLSIDYTSMLAHKMLQQTYKILKDTENMRKYKEIEFGLLYSIVNSGDGKTCETSWEVVHIGEEYFILDMIEAKLIKQQVERAGNNICDRMEVTTEDGDRTYYFGIKRVFNTYSKLYREE